jgi:uncharacterized protein (TIGR00375 family)
VRIVADLHVHSRYARACSRQLDLKVLEKYARMKGVHLLGTGDFTHPAWYAELKTGLRDEHGTGIYRTETGYPFACQAEVSLIYSQDGKLRRIHNLVLAPNLETVAQIQDVLRGRKGKLDSDGRPILGIPSPAFVELMQDIDKDIEVIPAHAWTPWFSLFGSNSGFDSIQDCFQDQSRHIHAIETGLSSDPGMNWRLSQLDGINLLSFSDLHSHWPWRIGREATVFDLKELTYGALLKAIRTGEGIAETLEFFPEEGKYHVDGHRACGVVLEPADAKRLGNQCPRCGRPLTLGVLHRVEDLADHPAGRKPPSAKPYRNLIPLAELIAATLQVPVASKKMWERYTRLVTAFGDELTVLLEAPAEKLAGLVEPAIVKAILACRTRKVQFRPGYDGVYGVPILDGMVLRLEGGDGEPHGAGKAIPEPPLPKPEPQKSLAQWG